MADALVHVDVVVQTTRTVKLDLSYEEAISLRSLFTVVGGDPKLSARKHILAIEDALDAVQVPYSFFLTDVAEVSLSDHSDEVVDALARGESAEDAEMALVESEDAEYGT